MQHLKKNRKFGRTNKQRSALLVSLLRALIKHEKITTTEAKAKSLRPYVEKLVTKGKVDTISNRRLLASRLDVTMANKLCAELGPRYKSRAGGYTRITKLSPRKSDASPMAVIEFVK